MAQALAAGLAASGALQPGQIGACARDRAKLHRNTEPHGFLAFDDAAGVAGFADVVVVAFGASARVARSAVVEARAKGVKAGLVRPITLWPFPVDALEAAVPTAKAFLTVEMNMGQMVDDVRLTVAGRRPVDFYGRTGGVIPTPVEVLAKLEAMNEAIAASAKGGE